MIVLLPSPLVGEGLNGRFLMARLAPVQEREAGPSTGFIRHFGLRQSDFSLRFQKSQKGQSDRFAVALGARANVGPRARRGRHFGLRHPCSFSQTRFPNILVLAPNRGRLTRFGLIPAAAAPSSLMASPDVPLTLGRLEDQYRADFGLGASSENLGRHSTELLKVGQQSRGCYSSTSPGDGVCQMEAL